MAQGKVFVRDATGLVKEFGALDMLLIAACLVFSLQALEVQFPVFYGFEPGADFNTSILIAAVPFVFLMLAYWAAGVIMPRSGSDYVWVGRILHPALGFAWSAYYVLALLAVYAGSTISVSYGASSSLSVWGVLYNSPSVASAGAWLSTSTGAFTLTLSLTLIFALLAILGRTSIKGLLYIGWFFAVLGIILTVGLLATTNPSSFAAKWDSVLSSYTSYSGIIQTATKSGFASSPITFAATLVSIPLVVGFLLGGNWINAVSGEIKNAKRAIPAALLLSLVLGIIFWTTISGITLNAVGTGWMHAIGYLYDKQPAAYNSILPFQPSMPLMLSVLAYPNQLLLFLIMISYIIGSIPTLFFFYWITSRYFFAWSFDRILPSAISDVNERFRSPHWAIAIITVISAIILYLINFTSYSSAVGITVLIWFSSLIPPSVAVAAIPYVKKDTFALAPAFFQKRLVGIPAITLVGAVSALSFSYMVYVATTNPLLATVTNLGVEIEVGLIALALAVYYGSVVYHRGKGIDIRLVFKELPPE